MSQEFQPEKIQYQILCKDTDFTKFNCSNQDKTGVNEFIHQEAIKYQQEKMGITYLFYYKTEVIAYVTVSMTCIDSREAPDTDTLKWFEKRNHQQCSSAN